MIMEKWAFVPQGKAAGASPFGQTKCLLQRAGSGNNHAEPSPVEFITKTVVAMENSLAPCRPLNPWQSI
ncbi:hypothetical protein GCM10010869_75930 [Mesorhizobium tianshanense]|nr:hypothetical protein GCM10010869_75930 [Mesorhizobium tianshanense]